jgi:hypothetical protein
MEIDCISVAKFRRKHRPHEKQNKAVIDFKYIAKMRMYLSTHCLKRG